MAEQQTESKSIFKTKAFWLNALSAGVEIAQLFTGTQIIPAGYLTVGVNAANVVLRRYSSGDETHVVTPRAVEPDRPAPAA